MSIPPRPTVTGLAQLQYRDTSSYSTIPRGIDPKDPESIAVATAADLLQREMINLIRELVAANHHLDSIRLQRIIERAAESYDLEVGPHYVQRARHE